MAQDDAEQHIAELERQLADAKAAAHDQEMPAQLAGPAAQASFPPPTQPSFPAPLLVPGPPTGSPLGQPILGTPFGSPLAQPPGPVAWAGPKSNLQRLVGFLRTVFFMGGIGALIYGVSVGAKMQRVSQGRQTAKCGNVFDAKFDHDAFHQYGGGGDLRTACAAQIAKAQPMTWGLLGLGVLLIVASFVFLVIAWTMKWRQGWRPWRPQFYGSAYSRMR
jgi:hypothetical protein